MLRQFHFIDQNGKDQGINVRNRAKELTELLGDVERIRAERKKARANKSKYSGVEGGSSRMGGFSGGGGGGSSSRYGGFGSDTGGAPGTFGGYSGGVYGDGGGFGGQTNEYGDSSSSRRQDNFEEYDEFDGAPKSEPSRASRKPTERAASKSLKTHPEPPKKKEPEVDLFSFDDPLPSSSAPVAAPSNGSGLASLADPAPAANDDDDFDDFQSAPPAGPSSSAFNNPLMTSNASGAAFAAPAPVSAPQQTNLNNMVGLSSISPPPANASTPGANYSAFSTPLASTTMSPAANKPMGTGFQPSGPNYFGSVPAPSTASSTPASVGGMGALKPVGTGSSTAKKPAAGGDPFAALFASASGATKKTTSTQGPAMGQLAKEKSAAGIWGAPASKPVSGNQPAASGSSGLDDLLG